MTHRKVVFPRTETDVRCDYVDLYRFGALDDETPLLVYVGGHIGIEEHESRLETEPTPILSELRKALEARASGSIDVLISPSPPQPRFGGHEPAEDFADYLVSQVFPALERPPPPAMGFVGYSYGAFLGTFAALGFEETRAIVSFGGVGVSKAIQMARPLVPKGATLDAYRNVEDEAESPACIARSAPAGLRVQAKPPRPGRHDFDDYARNGTVADAFRTVIEALARAG
jgi:hypothetical protein